MKLYFAGYSTDKEIFQIPEANNLLESYLLFKNKDYVQWHKERGLLGKQLFLDSGAFSAFSRGEVIDIDKYIQFVLANKEHIEVYATLDVIGDWEATKKNTEYIESFGLKPLATFHAGSPLEELIRMCHSYDYIALGGLVPLSMKRGKMKSWLDKCFGIIMKENPKLKVHGFGVNAVWAWERYPFYSVDATSWLMGGKFRRMVKFENGQLTAFNKYSEENSIEKVKVFKDHYTDINRYNVYEYIKAQNYYTRVWERRGIKWD